MLDAAQDALGDRPLSVLTTAGELVSVAAARARPWDVAAANWVATALAVAQTLPDALLIDVGSTTADIVPIADGRVAATGHNDLERLLAGELVYTGVLRTNLAAIAPRVPVRRRMVPGVVGVLRDQRRRPSRPRPPGAGGLRLPHARRPRRHRRVRARAHRPAGVLRRRAARRGRGRCDRGVPPRRAAAPARGGGAPGAARRCRPRRARRRRSARAPSSGARSPRVSGERSPRGHGARPTARSRPPPRWPRCWRRAVC